MAGLFPQAAFREKPHPCSFLLLETAPTPSCTAPLPPQGSGISHQLEPCHWPLAFPALRRARPAQLVRGRLGKKRGNGGSARSPRHPTAPRGVSSQPRLCTYRPAELREERPWRTEGKGEQVPRVPCAPSQDSEPCIHPGSHVLRSASSKAGHHLGELWTWPGTAVSHSTTNAQTLETGPRALAPSCLPGLHPLLLMVLKPTDPTKTKGLGPERLQLPGVLIFQTWGCRGPESQ